MQFAPGLIGTMQSLHRDSAAASKCSHANTKQKYDGICIRTYLCPDWPTSRAYLPSICGTSYEPDLSMNTINRKS